jgi:hypothetical protein
MKLQRKPTPRWVSFAILPWMIGLVLLSYYGDKWAILTYAGITALFILPPWLKGIWEELWAEPTKHEE